ncbi:hypothetical protein Pisl_1478 [Pyrobaculum islandicum DSM 4184]|uniref:Uncharacterized protein n=1 Tax=Pyrobaculum islandicum (strain DSM 4184 / JCM 9189 / GEO3) TaxID=384616 RepID=A1RUK2_PYRIL|nr:hypothetical protein [Pyrobaculum islandicum]ABL88634.1 hypothetical protein Pisl_1478 [Pyrobaculum islandicum DSM 4184]
MQPAPTYLLPAGTQTYVLTTPLPSLAPSSYETKTETPTASEITVVEVVRRVLTAMRIPVSSIRSVLDDKIGIYIAVVLEYNAREALKSWLDILDRLGEYGINIPIFVDWTGQMDVTPEELGTYLGKALAKMDLLLIMQEPIDAVEAVREEWET